MAAVLAPGSTAPAQEGERPSVNLYGVPGVIDMPSAIVQPDGQMTASYSAFGNTTRRNFSFQILPRVIGRAALREHQQLGRQPGLSSTAASTCTCSS